MGILMKVSGQESFMKFMKLKRKMTKMKVKLNQKLKNLIEKIDKTLIFAQNVKNFKRKHDILFHVLLFR